MKMSCRSQEKVKMSDNSNMQGFTLTSKEVKRLRAIHRRLRQRHEADVVKAISFAIDEANRLGLRLGLVASSSWNAGGSWVMPG
jgi:hypothetical protein